MPWFLEVKGTLDFFYSNNKEWEYINLLFPNKTLIKTLYFIL